MKIDPFDVVAKYENRTEPAAVTTVTKPTSGTFVTARTLGIAPKTDRQEAGEIDLDRGITAWAAIGHDITAARISKHWDEIKGWAEIELRKELDLRSGVISQL